MNSGDLKRVMDDIQILKYKINNNLLMCNVIMDELETMMTINDTDNDRTTTCYKGDRTCTSGTTTAGYTGDNYD